MTRADFNELVKLLSRKMYGYAYRILSNREESEDAVQEVFIKLWKMGEKLDEYSSIEALAITMTKNFCIDRIRKQKRSPREELKIQEYQAMTSLSPLEQMESKEANDIIHNLIEKLPGISRLVIMLRDVEGLSYEEIAQKTELNINNLRVTLSRARKSIRDEFNKYQYERKGIGQATGKIL